LVEVGWAPLRKILTLERALPNMKPPPPLLPAPLSPGDRFDAISSFHAISASGMVNTFPKLKQKQHTIRFSYEVPQFPRFGACNSYRTCV